MTIDSSFYRFGVRNETSIRGDNTRHTYRYVVLSEDPGAGDKINMRQPDDQTMCFSALIARRKFGSAAIFRPANANYLQPGRGNTGIAAPRMSGRSGQSYAR